MPQGSSKSKAPAQKKARGKTAFSKRITNAEMFADNTYVHEQLDRLIFAIEAFREGDISVRLAKERNDKFADLAQAYNSMVEMIGGVSTEVSRISRVGGIEGNLEARAEFAEASGVWKDLIDNINTLIEAIAKPVLEVRRILNSIAAGNLKDEFSLTVTGDFRAMADVINRALDSLNIFAEQVIRVASEVGVEGKLGGQAAVPSVAGTWKDLTDNVNLMASNLTRQVREIANVTTAVANGDLSRKITEEGKGGEVLELSQTINRMVDSLNVFAAEVANVAREVGIEGKLGGQADVPDVAGVWKDLTANVNLMATNLTDQVREIAGVATAVANGDLSKKIAIDVRGEIAELKDTINQMVDSLNIFAAEVTRVSREVGTEGKLGGQANVPNVGGTWKDLTESVNTMATNLTNQVREISTVATAVSQGDFSQRITEEGKGGEVLALSNTINLMVDLLTEFASEVSRVALEVGTEGKLGGQAEVPNIAGAWRDITKNVNTMATNLTNQVREIAAVASAVANGDLSRKITIDVRGEIADLKDTINQMVDSLNIFSDEVTRVAREVGTEGKLGGQADVPDIAGTWKDLTESVNIMATNLTNQVREISTVAAAVANGDLSRKITIDVRGEIADLKDTINQMVDSLNIFSDEVTRVAREVGTEGKLGGQAEVPNVAGAWFDLTNNVNFMASNLTNQVREIAAVATAVANGDLSQEITESGKGGEVLTLSQTINRMVASLNIFSSEVTRVAREVGTEGILGGVAKVPNVAGDWLDLTNNVNVMASNLTSQVREIATVATAVANGDLSRLITIEARGEIADLKDTINQMVDSLNVFAAEVTRVSREVGTEGKLGGQADVPDVAGTWKDLTENVNLMASNLTTQVREIATVTTAVANGDLSLQITETAKGGEVLELSQTINRMVDSLNIFADEVTNVAREVGTEGKLGGQAAVPNVAGAWKNLTDNVNLMAGNLTSQVRDIAGVSTALAVGDFSRKIEVEVRGEVLELKNNINAMVDSFTTIVNSANTIARGDFTIAMPLRSDQDELGIALNTMTDNLREISRENESERWLKTGQAGLNDSMRGEQDLSQLSKNIISYLTKYLDAKVGVCYVVLEERKLTLSGTYAYTKRKTLKTEFNFGESLVGQAALEKEPIVVTDVPDDYINISSGLGQQPPLSIVVQPFILENEVKGVLEIASFSEITTNHVELLRIVSENIAVAVNSAQDREKMQQLLSESQRKSDEMLKQQERLKSQSEELQATNEELEAKTKDLERQKEEIQGARQELEEKARELELSSKYKSEFLANMSHELRTPLNSLLILANDLAKNKDDNLTAEQVKSSQVIYDGGVDLLNLINDILDLSKVEAGQLQIMIEEVRIQTLMQNLKQQFEPVAKDKGLEFKIELSDKMPANIETDPQRLEQIIKNLLSNAFKFTERGTVTVSCRITDPETRFKYIHVPADEVLQLTVGDTGIGIPADKQMMIFEAFQQAEGGTARQFGGTGLGLTISRDLCFLLGGEIVVESEPGTGSQFTVYLPLKYQAVHESEIPVTKEPDLLRPQRSLSAIAAPSKKTSFVVDDRDLIEKNDSVILVVEDDMHFAEILQTQIRRSGHKSLVTNEGKEALELAVKYQPSGIVLDLMLPDIDGFKVLDNLKFNLQTRHIPVHVISMSEEDMTSLQKGAIGFLSKPVSQEDISSVITKLENISSASMKEILVVEDDKTSQEAIKKLLKNKEINITTVSSGQEALDQLAAAAFDCIILDLRLPDISGFDLLEKLQATDSIDKQPIVVYTGKDLTKSEVRKLNEFTSSIVVKGASSPERLLEEVSLFLHSMEKNLSARQKRIMSSLHDPETILKGRKVLLADDDMRNTYALSSILSDTGMEVVLADNGKLAIEKLKEEKDVDIVLMDIMMPVMDGYEAMQKIRRNQKYKELPIIALTAKAMAEDKAKCLEAGANDYLTKPVSTERLLNLIRVWLYEGS